MALIVGTNSYGSVAEADAYFADRLGYDKWAAYTSKDAALISAAQHEDLMCSWYELPCSSSQAMAFPRHPDCPNVPDNIKYAQFEIAYQMVDRGSSLVTHEDALTELKADVITLKFKATSPKNPLKTDLIMGLLSPYGLCSGGSGATSIIPVEFG